MDQPIPKLSAHGEPEPALREPKPTWDLVPKVLLSEIEKRIGYQVLGGEIVWGGFGPSATFKINFENGRSVFCKAHHSGLSHHVRKAFEAELSFFQNVPEIHAFSPQYLGSIAADGWQAMLFEMINDRVPLPPWSDVGLDQVLKKISEFHSVDVSKTPHVPHFSESEFSVDLWMGKAGWVNFVDKPEWIESFSRLFEDPKVAHGWLMLNLETFIQFEKKASQLNWQNSLTHQDLRSDNILISKSQGVLFADWPYFGVGPRALDIAIVAPSIEGEGGPQALEVIRRYERISGIQFRLDELQTAAVMVSGFFAAKAHLPDLPDLPRLRWVQRLQMFPAIRLTCELLDIDSPRTGPSGNRI